MTEDDLIKTYEQACQNAVVHGTGFIRIAMTGNGTLDISVVDPKDYRYLEPIDLTAVTIDEMAEVPPSAWEALGKKENP